MEPLPVLASRLFVAHTLVQTPELWGRLGASSALLAATTLAYGGPRHRWLDTFLGIHRFTHAADVHGHVEPGFERVREAFQKNVSEGQERGAQYVVYHEGRKVVDLYGGTLGNSYDGESLQIIFSSSKAMAALVVGFAVAAGRLRYDALMSEYWPEFAQNGKQDITVADALRHECGLAYFDTKVPMEFAARERLDEMADFLASKAPFWDESEKLEPKTRCYHGVTRGFVLNELIRRTDPKGRTMGQVLREEITEPLGLTIVLGCPTKEEAERVSMLEFDGFHHTIAKTLLKTIQGRRRKDEKLRGRAFFDEKSHVRRWMEAVETMPVIDDPEKYYNYREFHDLEVPSVNMLANARSLARVADLMSRGELLPEPTNSEAHSDIIEKYDVGLCARTRFAKGGFCEFNGDIWNPECHGFFGWGGFGGSAIAWNPKKKIGISYAMNGPMLASSMGFRDDRCLRLLRATLASIDSAENPAPKL